MLLALVPVSADAEAVRGPYLGLRLGGHYILDPDIAPDLDTSRQHSLYGLSIGVDLGRHLGLELAADFFEPDLRAPAQRRDGLGSIGELGMATVLPQLRLRYPVLGDRLMPYLVGGVGASFTQFNNRKRDGFGRSVHAEDTALAWTVGGGVEYFVASNIAIGAEIRYVGRGGHDIAVDGQTRTARLESLLAAVAARVYLRDGESARFEPAAPPRRSPFVAVRMGGAHVVNTTIARNIEVRPDNSELIPGLDNVLGFTVGLDLDRMVAVELAGEGYEMNLVLRGAGTIGEYAIVSFIPQLRLRYPLHQGRLLPSVLLGVGFTFAEFNDRKPPADAMEIGAHDFSPAGAFGVGIEYLIARNLGVGVDVRYVIARGHHIRIDASRERANLDALTVTAGLRVMF